MHSSPKRAQTVAVATPCCPAPVSATTRVLPRRCASSAWPSALLSLCAPVCSRSSRFRDSRYQVRTARHASAGSAVRRRFGRARRGRPGTTRRRSLRASPHRARRAPGSASRGRSAPRTSRTGPQPSSSRGRHELAHLRVVLDAGRRLELRRSVDGPWLHRAHSLSHVVGAETAGKHHAPFLRDGALQVERIALLPRQIDHMGDALAVAQEHRIAAADAALLAFVELHQVGSDVFRFADEDSDAEAVVGDVEDGRRTARAVLGKDEPEQVGACVERGVDVLRAREPAHLYERARNELSQLLLRIGSLHQRRADEDRVAPASSAAAPCARVWTPLSATTTASWPRSRRTSSSCRTRSIWNVVRSRALTPITSAPSATARCNSFASCASTSVSSCSSRAYASNAAAR